MKTLRQASIELDIPKGTVRQWVTDFGQFMSESATPPKGQVKQLDDNDMGILWTVYYLRSRHKSKDDIAKSLEAGDRFYPEPDPDPVSSPGDNQTAQNDTQEPQQAIEVYQAFKTTIESYERQIETKDKRINDLTDRLINAESRAAAAEAQIESKHVGWFDRLLGRG